MFGIKGILRPFAMGTDNLNIKEVIKAYGIQSNR